jgi:hypothetical protein
MYCRAPREFPGSQVDENKVEFENSFVDLGVRGVRGVVTLVTRMAAKKKSTMKDSWWYLTSYWKKRRVKKRIK